MLIYVSTVIKYKLEIQGHSLFCIKYFKDLKRDMLWRYTYTLLIHRFAGICCLLLISCAVCLILILDLRWPFVGQNVTIQYRYPINIEKNSFVYFVYEDLRIGNTKQNEENVGIFTVYSYMNEILYNFYIT